MWGIWKFRNKILFENSSKNIYEVVSKILLAIKEFPCDFCYDNVDSFLNPIYFGDNPLGFFDGTVVGGVCGVVVVLKISANHLFSIHLAIGSGSNIKAPFLGL